MAITDVFTNAVTSGNVRRIRIIMKDSLLVDPTFSEFKEMERHTQAVNGLYDEHDGRVLEEDPSAWNDDYMSKMMVQIVGNFSHERLEHLQKIVRHLHPVTSLPQARVSGGGGSAVVSNTRNGGSHSTQRKTYSRYPQTSTLSYQRQKSLDMSNNRIRTTSVVTGAVAGGIVGGTVVAVAGGSFIAGAAVGAVVVGAAVYVATSGR